MWIKWFSSHLTSLLCWCIWLFQGNLKAGFTLKHGATHSRSPERLNWLFHSEFSPNFGLNSDLKQTKRRLLYLFLYLYTYIQSFTNKHSGWVHTYANWMRVSPQQICMTRWVWLALNGVGSHISGGAAAESTTKGSCASLAPFQVGIQAKIQTWFASERENGDVPDPLLRAAPHTVWTQPYVMAKDSKVTLGCRDIPADSANSNDLI